MSLAELSDEERPAQQRLAGSLRQPLPVQLRPPLCNQNCVQRGHRRDAQHPKEISPGGVFVLLKPHCLFRCSSGEMIGCLSVKHLAFFFLNLNSQFLANDAALQK